MNKSELAAHYVRFWSDVGVADNAPVEFRRFVKTFDDPDLVHRCFVATASKSKPVMPDSDYIIHWFAFYPRAIARCDWLLSYMKKAPKSFSDLIQQTYAAELKDVQKQVDSFLNDELNRY